MTFSEVREYQYGDDIRSIDWNVTARFNHPYVKIFDEERELTVMLVIDVSGSNEFGTRQQLKEDLMTEIAAVLAFSAISNNDKVGVIFFSDKVEKYISPRKGRSHILRIICEMLTFEPRQSGTDISEALRYLTNVHRRRATAFLISDFLDDGYAHALDIAARKHDLVCLRVSDFRESDPGDLGLVQALDPESGKTYWTDAGSESFRRAYRQWWQAHEEEWDRAMRRAGCDHESLATDGDFVKPLVSMFRKREVRQ